MDVGCGYGFIGITIQRITDSYVDMIDVNTLSGINNETLIKDMTITEVGDRSKTYNDEKLN